MTEINYRSLTDSQKNLIKGKGMEVFKSIKNFIDPETNNDINHWLRKYDLVVSVPDKEFLEKNISDISFALIKLPLNSAKSSSLSVIREYLKQQLVDPNNKKVLLFHELKGDKQEWSLVNMFDNNILLWARLINKKINDKEFIEELMSEPGYEEGDIDFLLKFYFGKGDTSTHAAHDLFRAMIKERKSIFDDIFSFTWGGGQKVESNFEKYLDILGVSRDNFKNFSGEGNFVDRAGIDCAIKNISDSLSKKVDSEWIPVQIKPSQRDALKSIPFKGIAVYPYGHSFYYYESKDAPPKKIDELFIKKSDTPKAPPSVDYVNYMGWDKK